MSDIPSTKPYLIRAIYEWCVDSGFTPYLSVVVTDQVKVPRAFVRDGQIVLNIAPHATHQFVLDNEAMSCQARFGGAAHILYVPIDSIQAIYARENGQGMAFDVGAAAAEDEPDAEAPLLEAEPGVDSIEDEGADGTSTEPEDDGPPRPGGRGHLRIVK